MKINKFIIINTAIFISAMGCQTVGSRIAENQKETLVFKKNWVRSSLGYSSIDFKKTNRGTPLLYQNWIIQANAVDGLGAYELETGRHVWKKSIQNGVETGPILDKKLYFGSSDGYFYCLDPKTGQEIWKFKVGTEVLSEPTLDQDHVYFLSGMNVLYALKAATGESEWVYSRPNSSEFSIRGGARPVMDEQFIYAGFSDGFFVKINKKSGKSVWEISLNKNKRFKDIDAEAVIHEDSVYVSGYDDHLYNLKKNSGTINWKIKGGGFYPPTIYENILIYPTSQGEILGLQKNTSQKLWTYKVSSGISTAVKLFKGYLLFGETQGGVVLLNPKTGEKLTQFEPGRGVFSTPFVDAKTSKVYFISGEANIYSLTLMESTNRFFDFL